MLINIWNILLSVGALLLSIVIIGVAIAVTIGQDSE